MHILFQVFKVLQLVLPDYLIWLCFVQFLDEARQHICEPNVKLLHQILQKWWERKPG